MLSTTSGFTPNQAQRYRAMFHLLLVGVIILILGVGILCFGRMYAFDSSRYDLFTVFGIMIVAVSAVLITVPVGCQMKIYLAVQKAKDEGTSASEYGAPAAAAAGYAQATMGTQGYRPGTLPGGGPSVYHQSQYQQQQHTQPRHNQQVPFSSAAYMMSQQQQQNPMLQRMDQPRQYNESVAEEKAANTLEKQGHSQAWLSADKQHQQQQY